MRLANISRLLAALALLPSAGAAEKVSFNRDVQPILSEYCYHCHGPDSASRKAKLRLDRPEFAFEPAKSGDIVIVRGQPEKSPLIERITSKDTDEVMPPPESHKVLKPEEIAILRQWVKEGATYEEHWAFIKPERPRATPDASGWAKSPIDQFVVARLRKDGLEPNPAEDRARLFRRLSLDLTGLPPTPEETQAFLADRSPDAYEQAVDRMLRTDAHAEQMARHWLDAVRYADTHGIHFDNLRNIHPYRDWVINAFKNNQPFDQFTIEQLGGDLLPAPAIEQIVATGYGRCLPTTGEGGAIAEEVAANYAKDQVETMGAVWLGLTLGCSACHDHKFDPISTREFYQFSAFFRNTPMSALDGNNANHAPSMLVLRAEDRAAAAAIQKEIEGLSKQDAARRAKADKEFAGWRQKTKPQEIRPPELPAGWSFDAAKPTVFNGPKNAMTEVKFAGQPIAPGHYKTFMIDGRSSLEAAGIGDFEQNVPFTVQLRLTMSRGTTGSVVSRMDADKDYRGWDVWIEDGRPAFHLVHRWPNQGLKVIGDYPLPVNKPVELVVTYDGSGKASGVRIYVDAMPQPTKTSGDSLTDRSLSARSGAPFRIGGRTGRDGQGALGVSVSKVGLLPSSVSAADIAVIGKLDQLRGALGAAGAKAKPDVVAALRTYYDLKVDRSDRTLPDQIRAATAKLDALNARGSMTLIMKENPKPATARILKRGQYTDPGETVQAGTPKVLPPLRPAGASANRLDLARWLVTTENPLTARVTMNRLWYQFFGTGLSETTENLGIMGDKPTHPELLDWLAVEFMDKKWDLRHMVRLMVCSSTYRQSGAFTKEKLERDPRNRLMSRGPRYRLDAEIIRDTALATSGLLVRKVGGPSVRPYQPENIWSDVAMPESNTRIYVQDRGEGLYRRSMYTFLKRSAPHPMMLNFDATSREVFCTRRERSNSPLQSLNLMNDVQFLESSRVLAEGLLTDPKLTGDAARIDRLSWLLLSRPATADEQRILRKSLEAFRAEYADRPAEAAKLRTLGEKPADPKLPAVELAAWTLLSSQVFNRDETLNK